MHLFIVIFIKWSTRPLTKIIDYFALILIRIKTKFIPILIFAKPIFFQLLCCAAVCAVTVVSFVRCEQTSVSDTEDDVGSDKQQQANRRSIGEYHGLYAPATYHGHYAPHYYAHGFHSAPNHYHAASPDHYHLHANGYAPAHFHGHGYAPGHYHFNHEIAPVHEFKQQPIVYQSVVNTYPTATTVVHKPVPVPVAQPVPVPVARPVPVEVPRPYPVPVNRPYPVAVIKPVPVPVAQPYPVTVYKPYPVPVYRPLPITPVARPAVRIPVAVRVPLQVRPYPATSYVHSHRVYAPAHSLAYAPAHSHAYAPAAPHYAPSRPSAPSYLQQLAAVKAVQDGGAEYDVNEAVAAQQQQTLQEDGYSFLNEQQQDAAAIAADVYHHRHHGNLGHHHHHESVIEQDGSGYPSLTTDENSLGVPSTDYAGKKK